jgi:hypothetical protein
MKTPPFTRTVTVPKRNETTGEIMRDADGKPIDSDVTLGEFTFKRPTFARRGDDLHALHRTHR